MLNGKKTKLNWVLDVLLQRQRLQLFQILQHFNKNMHLFLFLTHASTFIIVFVQYDRTSQEIFESRGDQDTQKELDMDKTTQKRKCRRTWNEPINDKNDQVFKKGYYLLSRCRIFGMGVKMTLFIYLYNLHTQVCNSDVCLYWSVQSTCTGVPAIRPGSVSVVFQSLRMLEHSKLTKPLHERRNTSFSDTLCSTPVGNKRYNLLFKSCPKALMYTYK